jgi:cysteinyl-tRNA synthetase
VSPRAVRFFNTLGRRLEPLAPIEPGRVRLYTCGPTVYNHVHIGNLRTFLFEDLLKRALRRLGYDVLHVMNLTDVDDKTIRGAQERGVTLDEFTAPYIASFFDDLKSLGVVPADEYPRATRHVEEMQAIIAALLERGHAYASDGSIWFRIASDPDYGKLSGVRLEEARQGERVAQDEYEKEDVRDFVLWKGAKPGEPAWPSPWGDGRPGWHIECSAMSAKYLGTTFDVHCGGVDNMFPHHENEIAQSESATGEPFVRTWLHAEHLIVDGQKMSKSLGNQYTLPELIERGLSPRAIRYALVSVHYRQKLNFTFEGVEAAGRALARVDEMRFRLAHASLKDQDLSVGDRDKEDKDKDFQRRVAEFEDAFAAGLADDLNVSAALAAVFELVRDVNVAIEAGSLSAADRQAIEAALRRADSVLGVFYWEESGAGRLAGGEDAADQAHLSMESLQPLIDARNAARARRDFREADRIRDELAAQGIVLEDTPQGTRAKRLSGR